MTLRQFIRDDQAQATTEYILVLFIAIAVFLLVYAKLLKPMFQKVGAFITGYFTNLFLKGDLHRFPISR